MTFWEIEWNDGTMQTIESDDIPDEECIESGIDADSSFWGSKIKKIRKLD